VSLAVWEAGRFWATGEVGGPLGSAHQSQAPYQAVPTSDGWLTLGAITPKTWAGMCAVLSLDELVDDPRFRRSTDRQARRGELMPLIEERTQQHPTADLVSRLEAAGVPCAPIATYDQVFGDAHLAARDFFWDAPHPTAGEVRQVGSPMRLSRTPPVRAEAGPPLGRHTRAVLHEAGLGDSRIDALLASHGGS
jgi:crotonobetainyl-CoA:carnitine CoA-transferase CaiB-like acyl-CoA transferase